MSRPERESPTARVEESWQSLLEVARDRAASHPRERFLTFLANDGSEEGLSFGELDARARGLAATLQARGLAGERVLLLFEPGLDYVVGFWACLYGRAVAVPAYPPDPSQLPRTLPRLGGILEDSGSKAILTTAPVRQSAQAIFEEQLGLRDVAWLTPEDASPPRDWEAPEISRGDLAFLQYTSGSTGEPKGVMVSHGNLLANAEMIAAGMQLEAGMSALLWLPPYHDMGLIGGVIQPVVSRLSMSLMSPLGFISRPNRWLSEISRRRLRGSGAPNFALDLCSRRVSDKQKAELDLSSWEILFTGAEPVRPESLDRFTEAFRGCGFDPKAFYPCYGLAEATVFVTGSERHSQQARRAFDRERLSRGDVVTAGEEPSIDLVSVGGPAIGLDVRIVDPETRRPSAPGRVGEIWVAGASVALGYWGRQGDGDETFGAALAGDDGTAPRYLRTGDLGFISEDELFIAGRAKDLVIVNGANYHPQDIEEVVDRAHDAIRYGCTAAFALERPGGEILGVVAEVRSEEADVLRQAALAVRNEVTEKVGIAPEVVAFIAARELPKTSSGKVRRRATRAALLDGSLRLVARFDDWKSREPAADGKPRVARSPSELLQLSTSERQAALKRMALEAITELRGDVAAAVDEDAPVAELGLDSVDVVELLATMEEQCGVVLPMEELAQRMTLRQLISAVSQELERTGPTPAARLEDAR